jgi:ligand-binding SRPBCC domain-containing protein
MADHWIESRLTLARPRPEVFAFFADPRNLPRLTPPWVCLVLFTSVTPLAAGAVLDGRLRWLGVPFRWRAFVREFDPPYRFVDVQLRGPFARWEHRHRFLDVEAGTLVEDRVTYRLPGGALGRVVHALGVRRQIAAAWAYRTRRIGELVGPIVEVGARTPA